MIDLGAAPNAPEVQWVVQACNEGVAAGTCEIEATASRGNALSSGEQELPRALAVVRAQEDNPNVVSIEVRRFGKDQRRTMSRQLSFAILDPEAERWRTVGFAIAILVGRVERQFSPLADDALPLLKSLEALRDTPPPPPNEPRSDPKIREVWVASGGGAGAAGVVGLGTSGVRTGLALGASALAGWQSESGWVLLGRGQYVEAGSGVLLMRCSQMLFGGGYRVELSDSVAVSGTMELGVRWLSMELSVQNESELLQEQGSVWSPVAGAALQVQWQPFSWGGGWAAASVTSPFANSRVVDERDGSAPVSLPVVAPTSSLGLWLWL